MCRSKPQSNSCKDIKQKNFCEEENNSSQQASPESRIGMFYTKEQVLYKQLASEMGKFYTKKQKIRHLEAYDGHK